MSGRQQENEQKHSAQTKHETLLETRQLNRKKKNLFSLNETRHWKKKYLEIVELSLLPNITEGLHEIFADEGSTAVCGWHGQFECSTPALARRPAAGRRAAATAAGVAGVAAGAAAAGRARAVGTAAAVF